MKCYWPRLMLVAGVSEAALRVTACEHSLQSFSPAPVASLTLSFTHSHMQTQSLGGSLKHSRSHAQGRALTSCFCTQRTVEEVCIQTWARGSPQIDEVAFYIETVKNELGGWGWGDVSSFILNKKRGGGLSPPSALIETEPPGPEWCHYIATSLNCLHATPTNTPHYNPNHLYTGHILQDAEQEKGRCVCLRVCVGGRGGRACVSQKKRRECFCSHTVIPKDPLLVKPHPAKLWFLCER